MELSTISSICCVGRSNIPHFSKRIPIRAPLRPFFMNPLQKRYIKLRPHVQVGGLDGREIVDRNQNKCSERRQGQADKDLYSHNQLDCQQSYGTLNKDSGCLTPIPATSGLAFSLLNSFARL